MEYARVYRDYSSKNEFKFNVTIHESDLFVISDKDVKKHALNALIKYRKIIENHIKQFPEFLKSLKPLKPPQDIDEKILLHMYSASNRAKVGPFASVAGAIAQFIGEELLNFCNEIIIENGGDIYINTKRDRVVKIFSKNLQNIGIKIKKEIQPLAVCSSSSKIGHSLSFGKGDLVIVIGKNAALADAYATSICNKIKNEKDLQKIVNNVKEPLINGVITILNDKIAFKRKDFEFIKINEGD